MIGISYILKNVLSFTVFIIIDILTKNLIVSTFSLIPITILIYAIYDIKGVSTFYKFKFELKNRSSFKLLKNMLYFIIFNLLTLLLVNIPRIFVDKMCSDAQLGYFGILMMIPTVIILVVQIIIQPAVNRQVEDFNAQNYARIKSTMAKFFAMITFVSLLCSLAAFVLGPFAFKILYGVDFEKYRFIMMVLVISGMFNGFSTLISTLLTIIKNTKSQLFIYASIFILECIATPLVLKTFAFESVFIVYLTMMIIQFIVFSICYYIGFCKKYCSSLNRKLKQ